MRKYLVLTMAVLAAAALPTLALASDASQQNTRSASGAVQLGDAELDKVTAGNPGGIPNENSNGHASWGLYARTGACQHGGCQYGNSGK
jgi:hypothetical protein